MVSNLLIIFRNFHIGSLVECKGKLVKSKGKGQALDLVSEDIAVIGECDADVKLLQYFLNSHELKHF